MSFRVFRAQKINIAAVKILISGIGYSNMSDLSFGRVLLERLEKMDWSENVRIEDLNFGPIMIYQWFEETPEKFDKMILLHAARRGRQPGTLEVFRWDAPPSTDEEVQNSIGEAVTGVLSLENLLIVCRHFGVLPPEVVIVEVEPEREDFGMELSPAVAARADEALETVRKIAEGRLETG